MIVKFKCVSKSYALGWNEYVSTEKHKKDINNKGWSNYVTLDKKNNDFLREGATFIAPNKTKLANTIINALNYKTCATNIMISFESSVDKYTTRKAIREYFNILMSCFKSDEYIYNIIEHTDTDNIHYHIQIPKINLKTFTQLKIYDDKLDKNYNTALVEYICDKYNLNHSFTPKYQANVKKLENLENLEHLKAKNNQKITENFKNNKDLQKYITNLELEVIENLKQNNINDINVAIDNTIKYLQDKNINIAKNEDGKNAIGYSKENFAYYINILVKKQDKEIKRRIYLHSIETINQRNMQVNKIKQELDKLQNQRNERMRKRYKIKFEPKKIKKIKIAEKFNYFLYLKGLENERIRKQFLQFICKNKQREREYLQRENKEYGELLQETNRAFTRQEQDTVRTDNEIRDFNERIVRIYRKRQDYFNRCNTILRENINQFNEAVEWCNKCVKQLPQHSKSYDKQNGGEYGINNDSDQRTNKYGNIMRELNESFKRFGDIISECKATIRTRLVNFLSKKHRKNDETITQFQQYNTNRFFKL